jgi:hypothetical protein
MLTRLLTVLALVSLTVACEQDAEEAPPVESNQSLELAYISGHLGSYWDCPDDAMPARAQDDGAAREAPADAPGAVAGDCADGQDCGGFNSCQAAEVRVRVTNDGEDAVDALTVKQLRLDWGGGDLSNNEVIGLYDTDDAAYDGVLEPGDSVDLRIEFRGPHPSDVEWDQGLPATIEMGQETLSEELVTPELQMVPQVAT